MVRIYSGSDLAASAAGCAQRCSSDGETALEPLPSPMLARVRSRGRRLQVAFEQEVEGDARAAAAVQAAAAAASEAPACLGGDVLPDGGAGAALAGHVTEAHLLQFGAMIGEGSSLAALDARGAGAPLNGPGSLYGASDTPACAGPWEPIVAEAAPGVAYWAWRRPVRRGLYMYMTRTLFGGASPAVVRSFMMDDGYRPAWDDACVALRPAHSGDAGEDGESALLYSRFRFPKPMAPRDYVYARRVWGRPCDGGAYVVCRACPRPEALPPGRCCYVEDYAASYVIRTASDAVMAGVPPAAREGLHGLGAGGPSTEVLLVYFEDSCVRPALANIGIRKALWPMVVRTQRALRGYAAHAAAAASLASTKPCSGADAACDAVECSAVSGQQGKGSGGGSGVCGRMLGLLAAPSHILTSAASWLCRWQFTVAGLLPRWEWRLLSWVASTVGGTRQAAQLLLPAPPARVQSVSAPPNGLSPLRTRALCFEGGEACGGSSICSSPSGSLTLLRLDSYPLTADEGALAWPLEAGSPRAGGGGRGRASRAGSATSLLRSPLLDDDWPVASYAGSSYLSSWQLGEEPGRRRCCSEGGGAFGGAGGAASESGLSLASGSSGGGALSASGRRPRGARKRQLMVRLMQAASVRLAHKLLSAADARSSSSAGGGAQ